MRSLLGALSCAGLLLVAVPSVGAAGSAPSTTAARSAAIAGQTRPLAGRTVVVDPGHQLGNSRHPRETAALVGDGAGGRKACNTAGTATAAGYPEATFAWQVAVGVRDRLRRLGATVLMTRADNSAEEWGPCVDRRGRVGALRGADRGRAGARRLRPVELRRRRLRPGRARRPGHAQLVADPDGDG